MKKCSVNWLSGCDAVALDNGNGVKIFVHILWLSAFVAQAAVADEVTRSSGGFLSEYRLHTKSSIEREWVTIHNEDLPLVLAHPSKQDDDKKAVGVDVRRKPRNQWDYQAQYSILAKVDIVAVEINFLLFDIWGEHIKHLTATEVLDIDANSQHKFMSQWMAGPDVEVYYASVAYISRVRTKGGKVYEADLDTVVDVAREFHDDFRESDLALEDK